MHSNCFIFSKNKSLIKIAWVYKVCIIAEPKGVSHLVPHIYVYSASVIIICIYSMMYIHHSQVGTPWLCNFILASLLKPRSPISGSCLHALCNCYRYELRLLHNVNATKFLAWKEWLFSRWICSRALHVRPSQQLLQGFFIVQLSVCNVHTSSFSVSFFVCPSIKRI